MADEQKNPEEEAVTPEYADAETEVSELEEIETENAFEESVTETIEATAEASEDNPVAEAWDDAVEGIMEATEDLVDGDDAESHEHHYTDEVVLPYFGSIGSMPGGIYTFIFLVLGAVTLIEVLVTIIFPENAFSIAILVALSLIKAYLVVMYYMHLNSDNKLFRVVLLLPLIVVLLSTLYLLGVPATAGLGYN